MVDGRRIWLVSGSIHYARVPRALWPARIAAARNAGLNCVCTDVFWNVHEPQLGEFYFDGEADLRHFIQLIGRAGLYCILRPGPYVGGGWDFGGLPPWLTTLPRVLLRQATREAPGFLEATARYFGALMDQVSDLQLTSPVPPDASSDMPGGGPIVLVQAEHEWFCHHDVQAQNYLREVVRYLRENGCTVPITTANNFWQPLDGAFDTWNADQHLATDLRQLHQVQPNAPRLVSELWSGRPDHWGQPHEQPDAALGAYRLAQILAAGAQYNVHMFHGGTNFGFYGGRQTTGAGPGADTFVTTGFDCDAPVSEAGRLSDHYWPVKRISTFASQFANVLAHLVPGGFHAAVEPNEQDHPPSVIHLRGDQGDVVFLIKSASDRTEQVPLMLPQGLSLPVPIGAQRVAWLLLRTSLGGVAELNYTNLSPWAFIRTKMLVLFGPAGSDGLLAINDAAMSVKVPADHTPLVDRHEGLTIVVLNTDQVDAANITNDGLLIGAAGVEDGTPIHMEGWGSVTSIGLDGQTQTTRIARPKQPPRPKCGAWVQARQTDFANGTSDQFSDIDGPASLEALGGPYGYGWYRLTFDAGHTARVLAPHAADRLTMFQDAKASCVLGVGPGAQRDPISLALKGECVLLADNMGRFDDGWRLGEKKGLHGHLFEVKSVRLSRARTQDGTCPDPFELGGYFRGLRQDEHFPVRSYIWSVKSIGGQPLILQIDGLPARAMVHVNGHAVGLYDPKQTAGHASFLMEFGTHLRRRPNELRLTLFEGWEGLTGLSNHLRVYQCVQNVTAKAKWSFAPWTMPAAAAFEQSTDETAGLPTWYRCTFSVSSTEAPLWLEPQGMSKGQIFLNDINVGRYYVSTATRKRVGPQFRYYLPEPWLKVDEPNELALFDELGRNPSGCRLVYDK